MSPSAVYPEEYKVIDTTLNHYLDPEDGGHTKYVLQTASAFRRKFDVQPVQIGDIRGRENQFDLNTAGFQFVVSPTACTNLRDSETLKREAYPETEKLLKVVTGCTRVHVVSHLIRSDSRDEVEEKVKNDPTLADDLAPIDVIVPARFIHIDQSEYGAIQLLEDNIHPPELAQKLRRTRWSLINVWRPIKPVFKDPVAMCDWRTLDENDLVPIPAYMPPKGSGMGYAQVTDGEGFEAMYLRHNPTQQWYYRNGMEPGGVLMFKCFDTINDGKTARRCPHSAFVDPTNTDQTTRESVELRCLLFYEDQPLEG